jgi:signal transduction histidine kinase
MSSLDPMSAVAGRPSLAAVDLALPRPASRLASVGRVVSVRRDLVLMVALFCFGLAELLLGETYQGSSAWPGPGWAGLLQVCWLTVPLAWRRSTPLGASLAVFAGVGVSSVVWGAAESTAAFLVIVVTMFSGIAYARRPGVVIGAATVALAVHNLNDPAVTRLADWFWSAGFVIVAGLLGAAQRSRQVRIVALQHDADVMAREYEARAAAATAAERAAIARELHDVVAHAVSVIVIHAQAGGRAVDDDDPATARLVLGTIEDTGRSALADLRRMLQLLDTTGPPLDPSPGLAHLHSLLDGFRTAGVSVTLELPDPLPTLSGSADLAAYRLVQEALTNVLRHAPGAHVTVRVTRSGAGIEVLVENDGRRGPAAPAPVGDRPGRGLIGMRERVSLAGGTLQDSGPTAGGFRIRAQLPVEPGSDVRGPSSVGGAQPVAGSSEVGA